MIPVLVSKGFQGVYFMIRRGQNGISLAYCLFGVFGDITDKQLQVRESIPNLLILLQIRSYLVQ